MFKIDKSSVEYIDSNKSAVIIRYWSPQDNRFDGSEQEKQTVDKKIASLEDKRTSVFDPGKDAQKIIEQAYIKADEIKALAREEGYKQGLSEADKKLEALMLNYQDKFNKTLSGLQVFQDEVIKELEECILQLSFDVAEKIVNIQLEKDDILFVGIVKAAIERLNAREKFTVRLNELQFEKYFQGGTDWLVEEMQCAPFTVVKDPGIAPYGCVLESDEGIIDAGVQNQLKCLKRTFVTEEKQYDEAL